MLLIDEVDRADDEFEAFLLEILSDYAITVPELGTFQADVAARRDASRRTAPATCTTRSKRRCLYHWVEQPDFDREVAIVRLRAPEVGELLARQVAAAAAGHARHGLYKPPGVAETIDWAQALATLGRAELDEASVAATLGTVLKYREDQERVARQGGRRPGPRGGPAWSLTSSPSPSLRSLRSGELGGASLRPARRPLRRSTAEAGSIDRRGSGRSLRPQHPAGPGRRHE